MNIITPSKATIDDAKKHPNGYVYAQAIRIYETR